ncbi:MAG: hypothetical protein PHQ43_02910 [Dehalococcoidales bacterium]|jgi:hypothetical protein|nr:hypothetical protein [Dehalococcoidales bacterium]
MVKNRQPAVGKNKVSIRVLLSESDYQSLVKLAELERTDIGSMVRRAVVLQYSLPPNDKTIEIQASPANNQKS